MVSVIAWILITLLACIGITHLGGSFAVRFAKKGAKVVRVFPISGSKGEADAGMAFFYTSLQWEANPSRQLSILYNAGLTEESALECAQLAHECGALYANSAAELADFLHPVDK